MLHRYLRYGVVCAALLAMCGLSVMLVDTRVLAVNAQQNACAGTPVPVNPPTNPPNQPPPATPIPTTVVQPTPSPVPVSTPTPLPDPVVSPTATAKTIPTKPVAATTPTATTPSTVTDTTTPIAQVFSTSLLQPVAFTVCTPTPMPTTPASNGGGGIVPPPTTTNGQPETPTPATNAGTPGNTKQKKSQVTPVAATPPPTTSSTTPASTAVSSAQTPSQSFSSLLLWILLGMGSVVLLAVGTGVYWLVKRRAQVPAHGQLVLAAVPQTPAIPWAQKRTLEPATLSAASEMIIASPVLGGVGANNSALIPPPLDKNVVLPPPPAHVRPAAQAQSAFSAAHIQPPLGQPSGAQFSYQPAELQPISVSLSQTLSMAGNQQHIQRVQENHGAVRQPGMDGLDFASIFDQQKQFAGATRKETVPDTDHTAAVARMTTFPPIVPEEATRQESPVELPTIQNDPLLETIMKQAQFGIYAPATRKIEMQTS